MSMTRNEVLIGIVDAGVSVLSKRVLTLLGLAMTMGLFCWSMYLGTPLALTCAAIFGVTIFLPVLWRESRSE